MYELTVISEFSSAHNIRGCHGACERLHGHNWRVEASIKAETLDRLGMVIDFKRFKTGLKIILDSLDHRYLNDIPPFNEENATAENIARHIFSSLSKALDDGNIKVTMVRVWESNSAAAAYYG
ncbi:MAG: 6-carboxytetrahydropterin synthase QueD [Deltaproteobacteria bacterium]|nr:6-carboxytetrahydropterin synthase QueD [Deltaproteobacteria bacterium]